LAKAFFSDHWRMATESFSGTKVESIRKMAVAIQKKFD